MVLSDCEESLRELMKSEQSTLRRRWVATVSLLRAVDHVLWKVDGKKSTALGEIIKQKHDEIKLGEGAVQPPIFWGFIEDERNNVLKEYRFAIRGSLTIGLDESSLQPAAPGLPVGRSVGMTTDQYGTRYSTWRFKPAPLECGPFAGHDPVQVVREAIAFWHSYLDDVDRRVADLTAEVTTVRMGDR